MSCMPVFVNQVLLEHNYGKIGVFIIIYVCFWAKIAELSSCDRDCPQSLKCWVGQKVRLRFSIRSYGNPNELFGQANIYHPLAL